MKRWLTCVALIMTGAAVGCATAPRVSDGSAPLYDDAVARDSNIARAGEPVDSARRALDEMPGEHVKAIYLACSGEVTRRPLGGGEAAFCSIVYDVLLTRHFGGDFHDLLAWSRQADAAGSAARHAPVAAN